MKSQFHLQMTKQEDIVTRVPRGSDTPSVALVLGCLPPSPQAPSLELMSSMNEANKFMCCKRKIIRVEFKHDSTKKHLIVYNLKKKLSYLLTNKSMVTNTHLRRRSKKIQLVLELKKIDNSHCRKWTTACAKLELSTFGSNNINNK